MGCTPEPRMSPTGSLPRSTSEKKRAQVHHDATKWSTKVNGNKLPNPSVHRGTWIFANSASIYD